MSERRNPPLFYKRSPVRDALTRKPSGWIDYEVHCGDCRAFGLIKVIGGGPEEMEINRKVIERWEKAHPAPK